MRRISRAREKSVTVDVPLYSQTHGGNASPDRNIQDAMHLQDLFHAGGSVGIVRRTYDL